MYGMTGDIIRIIGIAIATSLIFLSVHGAALPPGFCFPDNGTLSLGVFAPHSSSSGEGFIILEDISAFQKATGKKPAIAVFSDEWSIDKKFPLEIVTSIRNLGMTPYVRLMMRSTDKPYQKEPVYTLKNIALGKFDGELRAWARQARAFGSPIIIEYGTEINQWSYPWNGYWNSNDYGQVLFKDAYRHIQRIMNEEGASNLIFAYHMNAESQPDESWNNATSYYPGDEYCDVITVSLYGTKKPFETGKKDFTEIMNKVTSELERASIFKPVLISTGTDMRNRFVDPASFVKDAVSSLSGQTWPGVKAFIWHNAAWKNDNNPLHDSTMRLQDNSSVSQAFQSALLNTRIKDQLSC